MFIYLAVHLQWLGDGAGCRKSAVESLCPPAVLGHLDIRHDSAELGSPCDTFKVHVLLRSKSQNGMWSNDISSVR